MNSCNLRYLSWMRAGRMLAALTICLVTRDMANAGGPNILWLSCEDISPHLGCYGDPHAVTPNLDAFAKQSTRFSHAFTTAGVCAPCRSSIITGMYQNSIGTHHMRCDAKLPKWLKPFPMYLREAGYYCTNNSKTDYQFSQPNKEQIWDDSSSRAHWKNRAQDQPFFAVFNFTGCHESGIAGEAKYREVTSVLQPDQRQAPATLTTLPPYYPDTPIVREDWKRNYELITAMDAWVGEHLAALEAAGLAENTIVFFWSDHGVGLPRAKRWLYDSGTRIPFIVHMPEQVRQDRPGIARGLGQPGDWNDCLVSSVDFGPTVLSLAGLPIPEWMQGQAFLSDGAAQEREFVYGARDRMDERYDIIRSVRTHRFRYIRNFEPLKPYYQYMNTPEKGATMQEIRRCESEACLPESAQQFSLGFKPVEEFYDLENDPHEIHNLIDEPAYADEIARLRQVCFRWQMDVRDLGLMPEAEINLRQSRAGSQYEILREPGGDEMVPILVDVAALASEGSKATQQLLAALSHDDAAVRYWGATGLGNTGAAVEKQAVAPLTKLLKDTSPNVRVAAARGLCRMGQLSTGLPVLQAELSGAQQWARLAAAIALDELDEDARPALDALQAALDNQPNKYIVRVANKAVNDLLGTNHEVP